MIGQQGHYSLLARELSVAFSKLLNPSQVKTVNHDFSLSTLLVSGPVPT